MEIESLDDSSYDAWRFSPFSNNREPVTNATIEKVALQQRLIKPMDMEGRVETEFTMEWGGGKSTKYSAGIKGEVKDGNGNSAELKVDHSSEKGSSAKIKASAEIQKKGKDK